MGKDDIKHILAETKSAFVKYNGDARELLKNVRSRDEIQAATGIDLITGLDLSALRPVQGIAKWEDWKQYLALHPEAEKIIGTGVIRFSLEYIPTTRDPNNYGKERLDFHVYRHDGSYARLHPGSHKDAQVYYFDDCNNRPHSPAMCPMSSAW